MVKNGHAGASIETPAPTDEIQKKLNDLENRVQLLEIIVKKQSSGPQPEQEEMKKVIQINAKGKKYFCETPQEQQVFSKNNPGVKTETFNIELPILTANERLNAPGNREQFAEKAVA